MTAPAIDLLKVGRSAEKFDESVKILKCPTAIGIPFFC